MFSSYQYPIMYKISQSFKEVVNYSPDMFREVLESRLKVEFQHSSSNDITAHILVQKNKI